MLALMCRITMHRMLQVRTGPHELFCSVAACDLKFQNAEYSNKIKYNFPSTHTIIVLLKTMYKKQNTLS